VGGTYNHDYYWDITVDGEPAGDDNGYFHGTGGETIDGIPLTGLTPDVNHQIRITLHGGADPGWGNAFGYCDSIFGAHTAANKQKLISIDAPLTTMAFAPKIAESGSTTNASWMFGRLFTGCSKFTTPAVITDTYKLPETITNLSSFLAYIHVGNSVLTKPVDLAFLSGWFNGNNSIEDLSNFLASIHRGNSALSKPIDLTSLSGWFKGNNSIKNLSNFLFFTHYGNSALADPIKLAPLSGWFKGNTSIENLSSFLCATYYSNSTLVAPVNLMHLKDWFSGNTSINNLSYFLYNTHSSNIALAAPVNLMHLKDWFASGKSINNLTAFLDRTHQNNPGFKLSNQPFFPDWIRTMKLTGGTPIWNVGNAFFRTFYLGSSQSGNAEPVFQNGGTLSSLGAPNVSNIIYTDSDGVTHEDENKGTYTNRDSFFPSNLNWK
jgi:hypothetical protein